MIVEDAVALLEAEHAATRELLAMLLRIDAGDRRRARIVTVLAEDLWIHMQLEEEILHSELATRGLRPSDGSLARDAIGEELARLERCDVDGPELAVVAQRLLALHEAQSRSEELELHAAARRVLSRSELVALGNLLRARRQELRESGAVRREPTRAQTPRVSTSPPALDYRPSRSTRPAQPQAPLPILRRSSLKTAARRRRSRSTSVCASGPKDGRPLSYPPED